MKGSVQDMCPRLLVLVLRCTAVGAKDRLWETQLSLPGSLFIMTWELWLPWGTVWEGRAASRPNVLGLGGRGGPPRWPCEFSPSANLMVSSSLDLLTEFLVCFSFWFTNNLWLVSSPKFLIHMLDYY